MCNLICVYPRRGGMENVGLSGHKYKPAPSSIPASFSHASPHLAGEINLWEEEAGKKGRETDTGKAQLSGRMNRTVRPPRKIGGFRRQCDMIGRPASPSAWSLTARRTCLFAENEKDYIARQCSQWLKGLGYFRSLLDFNALPHLYSQRSP